ncbi:MarR family winged helix-turn-helix transcriptional regulator [Methanobacterium ferruginis]|jgi:DNA-binding MarR family transcriptional regulator|uniref:MarR family winged helix-turn-helix transcriptional regulator n=1 Tax=Methanobacterium ferruginis TaxID=710191 RepID=UPI0025743648|nr:MarR family transcriptional regulator [Methanobacterium ferruginis]MCC7550270.1 MarR family transcriptional regulator [Methanobacterium sp.]BDZ67074.1 MarR family transcriptional regulator [Methanobacterium ferruginis]
MHKIEKIIEEDLTDIPLGILISIIHRTRMMYLNNRMKSLNVTASQSLYLIGLYKKEGQTQEDLATHFFIDKGTVARGVKKLEDNGFISRKTDPENRRRYLLYITEDGKALMPEIWAVISDWEDVMNKDFTEAERQRISDFLKKLTVKGLNKLHDTEENLNE